MYSAASQGGTAGYQQRVSGPGQSRPSPVGAQAGPRGMMAGMQQQHQRMGSMPPQQPAYKGTLAPGTRVAVGNITVTVKKYLSEGGFAHVYLVESDKPIPIPVPSAGSVGAIASGSGRSTRPETLHVLKRMAVPNKDALMVVRGEVEAHRLLRNQPSIVHFIEASATSLPTGGYEVFILMEYCSGGGIIDFMNTRLRDRLREDEVLKIFGDICAGVAVMHHLDPPLMHRDLKIENILLSPAPPDNPSIGPIYKLCDFGSAAPVLSRRAPKSLDEIKRVEEELNRCTTLPYRAPEMVDVYQRRVIDEKADIWALGVLLYKLCYFTTPFEENGGGPLAILSANYRIPPQPPYSQRLKDLIASLLQEQGRDRPTIDQVVVRVHQILGSQPPPSALHYAQQAAQGKQFQALPSVVSSHSTTQGQGPPTSSKPAMGRPPLDDTALIHAARMSKASTSTGLASPTAAGMDLIRVSETEEDRRKAEVAALQEGVTPMRRGRPNRGSALTTAALPTPGTHSNASPSAPPKQASIAPIMTQLTGEGSAPKSSSVPSNAAAATVSRNFGSRFAEGRAVFEGKKPSATSAGFDDSFSPSLEVPKLTSSRPTSALGSGRSPGTSSPQGGSLLDYSPEMPGFSTPVMESMPTVSPRLAPSVPAPRKGSGEDDDASTRFPSVEEIDARYSTSKSKTVVSASSSLRAAQSSPTAAPTLPARDGARRSGLSPALSPRESVGAMATRLNSNGQEKPNSAKPLRDSLPPKPQGIGSLAGRWPHTQTQNGVSPSLSPKLAEAATMEPTKKHPFTSGPSASAPPPRDWLTGDDTEEAIIPPASDIIVEDSASEREKESEEDSDDEPEGPEDLSRSAAERYGGTVTSAEDRTAASGPVKAPDWDVDSSPNERAKPTVPSLVLDDASSVEARPELEPSSPLDEDDRDLALIEGRLPRPRQIQAPSWDEMDDSEMRALSLQPIKSTPAASVGESAYPGANSSPRAPAPVTTAFGKTRLSSLISQAEQRDQGVPANTQPPVKQYADASTSPIEPEREKLVSPVSPVRVKTTGASGIMERMQGFEGVAPRDAMPDASVSKDITASPVAGTTSIRDRYKPAQFQSAGPSSSAPLTSPKDPVNGGPKEEPQINTPLRNPASRAGSGKPAPPPPSSLKPWEREAAAAAEISRGGVVKSSAAATGEDEEEDEEEHAEKDPAARRPGEAQERFRGVSDLISRWQASTASNAPGWGRVGESQLGSTGKQGRVGQLGSEAASAASVKRASSILPRSTPSAAMNASRQAGRDV